jgi:6-phosphogluconolactonase
MSLMRQGNKSRWARLAVVIAMVAALPLLGLVTGCGEFFSPVNNNPGGTGTTSYVYVTNIDATGTGGTLTAYSLTSGVLAQLSGSPITLAATPTSIVVAPNNAFLYVGTTIGVYLYTIGTDGTLTQGNNDSIVYSSLGASTQVQSMVVDSTSSWLMVTNLNSSALDAVAVDPTTGLPTASSPLTQEVTLSSTTPLMLSIAPANNNIFVAMGVNGVNALSFTATSASAPMGTKIVPIPVHVAKGADNAVTVDPTSTYLYVGEATSNQLRLINISTNLLADVADYPIGAGASAILADPTSAYVYVANKTDGTISGFSQSAGALTALGDSPYDTTKLPIGLVEDSSKTYVIAIGFGANPNFWLYNYDTSSLGTLDVKTTTSTGTSGVTVANAVAVTH